MEKYIFKPYDVQEKWIHGSSTVFAAGQDD